MIAFTMDVNSSLINESDITNAQTRLLQAYQFGGLYLRSGRMIQGRGLRVFKGIGIDIATVNSVCIYLIPYVYNIVKCDC